MVSLKFHFDMPAELKERASQTTRYLPDYGFFLKHCFSCIYTLCVILDALCKRKKVTNANKIIVNLHKNLSKLFVTSL